MRQYLKGEATPEADAAPTERYYRLSQTLTVFIAVSASVLLLKVIPSPTMKEATPAWVTPTDR